MNKKIGIVGTRRRNTYNDYLKVFEAFEKIFKEGDIIVSGGCRKGGDNFAEKIAHDNGLTIIIHYPNWRRYRARAGMVRNTLIARDSDFLIACVAKDRKGGTEDTIKKFKDKKLLRRRLIIV